MSTNRRSPLFWVGLSVFLILPLSDSVAGPESGTVEIPFQEFKLDNGLRVILSEDHSAPTYSICVTYNAGSRDERRGRTGFAHLFEHMMFQGSENVGKGEHFILIENNGGDMNGTTNADRTNYYEALPSNQLDLGLFLEADRMRSLVIDEANLENQRKTVQEERRRSYDNRPYGRTWEAVLDTVYDNFAYKHSTIGSMEDLSAATVQDVAEFFRIYYAPNNAVLALVGDFKTETALGKIKKHFGNIPSQPAPPVPDVTEPPQEGERRKTIEDAFARAPRIDIVFKTPPGNTPDWYALSVVGELLVGGRSSRLYQKLVKEKEVATDVYGGAYERRGPSLLELDILARPDGDLAEIEGFVYQELERLQRETVSESELNKVLMQVRRQRVQELVGTLRRSVSLARYAIYFNEPGLINKIEENYRKVTQEDIKRVSRTFLVKNKRSVIFTLPKKKAPAKEKG